MPRKTLPGLVLVAAALSLGAAPSPSPTPVPLPIDLVLSIMNISEALNPSKQICPPETAESKDLVFNRAVAGFDKKKGCDPFSLEELCRQATEACVKPYKSVYCKASDPAVVHRRFTSRALRKNVFGKAARYFNEKLHDPTMLERCCGKVAGAFYTQWTDAPVVGCQNRLARTKLYVLKGLPADDATAQFRQNKENPRIEFSEGLLLGIYNEQTIERLLLHELGHACEYARQDFNPDLNECGAESQKLAGQDFEDRFGRETRACVETALATAAAKYKREKNEEPCRGEWLQEAFADAIYLDRRTELSHWSWSCNGGEDHMHAQPKVHLKCMAGRPEIKELYCK